MREKTITLRAVCLLFTCARLCAFPYFQLLPQIRKQMSHEFEIKPYLCSDRNQSAHTKIQQITPVLTPVVTLAVVGKALKRGTKVG